MLKLNAKELRTTKASLEESSKLKKNPIYIICDNILDTYNVGSIFRLADAVAAEKVFLCGITETPPNTRIKKASINTTEWVSWQYFEKTEDAIKNLRQFRPQQETVILSEEDSGRARIKVDIQVIAIEQGSKSVPFNKAEYGFPIAFVVGNESTGISREALNMCDTIIELPMYGVNKSLNVMVSLGIVLYTMMSKISSLSF